MTVSLGPRPCSTIFPVTWAVAAALSAEFAVVAVAKQCVVVRIGLDDHTAPRAAIAAGRPTARDVLFPAEGDAAIPAVAGLQVNLGFVNEHSATRSTQEDTTGSSGNPKTP